MTETKDERTLYEHLHAITDALALARKEYQSDSLGVGITLYVFRELRRTAGWPADLWPDPDLRKEIRALERGYTLSVDLELGGKSAGISLTVKAANEGRWDLTFGDFTAERVDVWSREERAKFLEGALAALAKRVRERLV